MDSGVDFTPESGETSPGLYIHIPFCKSKCSYCSFNSVPCSAPPAGYLAALRRQARFFAAQPWCRQRTFASIFIGGGTPTIYDGADLAALVAECRSLFDFAGDAEVSVECNPNTVTAGSLACLRRAGVNRLSIGIQAFSDTLLQEIGRTHSVAQAHRAVALAREAGFGNLNLDLMYGLPGQDVELWSEGLRLALDHSPEHLALYELTIEEETPFFRMARDGILALPKEEEVAAMEEGARNLLAAAGYSRYEISNYARPGFACRHNINYWQNGSYVGLGAGAVSCLSGVRLRNVDEPGLFTRLIEAGREPYGEAECLPLEARFRETVIMGLRLLVGVSLSGLQQRFGLTVQDYYGMILQDLFRQDLVELGDDFLRLTTKGLPVANQVLARLV